MSPAIPIDEDLDDFEFDEENTEYLAYGKVAEEIEGCLAVGLTPSVEMLVAKFPEFEREVRELVPALAALVQLGDESRPAQDDAGDESADLGMLGDFRILREIGRGGMGIVYEAAQISLKRRVALKVLPFAAVLDQKQLQRFKTEAQAAARLQHQSIVPIYSVGCDRGVHFYAMQYIEGQNLSEAIRQLRVLSGIDPTEVKGCGSTESDLASGLASGRFAPEAVREDLTPTNGRLNASHIKESSTRISVGTDDETGPTAALPTEHSTSNHKYFRTVANLGIQAAEALEFAHQQGIIHRDVKPSNLMLDANGKLWITDFGLARVETDPGLTTTGDLVGTLRYMSPEQIWGEGVVDHRTDIYALGATLYELLTLEPIFSDVNRQELLKSRANGEPLAPRRVNKAIPRDLETIILKTIAKAVGDRYATAQDVADDLRRYVQHQPILAARPKLLSRASAWSRRSKTIAWSAVTVLVAAALFISGVIVANSNRPGGQSGESNAVGLAAVDGPSQENISRQADAGERQFVSAKGALHQLRSPQPDATENRTGQPNIPNGEGKSKPPNSEQAEVQGTPSPKLADALASLWRDRIGIAVAVVDRLKQFSSPKPLMAPKPPVATPDRPVAKAAKPPMPRFKSESDKAAYLKHLRDMFEIGYERGRKQLETARTHFEAARRLNTSDPRVDYAFGLVLINQLRYADALNKFDSAATKYRYPYLPAWKAKIWQTLLKKENETGSRQLVQLAGILEQSEADWPDAAGKLDCARWMGRTIGFLEALTESSRSGVALSIREGEIRELFTEKRLQAYELGKRSAQKDVAELIAANDLMREKVEKQQEVQTQEELATLAKQQKELRSELQKLEMSSGKWKQWLDKETAAIEKSLANLEKEYAGLEEQAKSTWNSMLILQQETITLAQNDLEFQLQNNRRRGNRFADLRTSQAIQQRNDQLRRYQQEYNTAVRRAGIVRKQATAAVAKRRQIVRRYQQATGKLVKKNATLQNWEKRLSGKTQNLAKPEPNKAAQLKSSTDRNRALRMYFKLDLEGEKQRVLQSYTNL